MSVLYLLYSIFLFLFQELFLNIVHYFLNGIEGTHSISLLNETNPTLYATRYICTKQFLSYYDKTYSLIKEKYIDFQFKLKRIVDYVYNLNDFQEGKISDKYAKLMAISRILEITEYTLFD